MGGAKIAVQTKCLAQPIKQALHTAARLGCEGVQIDLRSELPAAELSDTGRRQLRKMLDDLNLRMASVAFPTRRGYAAADELERRLAATVEAMRAAAALGARTALIALDPLPGRDSPQRATLEEALSHLAAQAARLGVQLAGQCPAAEPREVEALLQSLPEGCLGVDLSPADQILHGRNPRDFIEALGPRIFHVFANDAVQGAGGASGAVDVQLGRGSADVPELLGMLEEYGYRGWLTIERRHSPHPVEEVDDAVKFLRSL